MEVISLDRGVGECVMRASAVLRRGGVILYPTDTLYGLGVDAFSDEAVAKVLSIKGRDEKKPVSAVFADLAMIEQYAVMNEAARRLAEKFLPGPLTFVLEKKSLLTSGIARGMDTIGVRIPQHEFCIETARALDKPFTATSANRAGQPNELSLDAVLAQFGDSAAEIDLVIDAGTLPLSQPSTVVNVVSGNPVVLREGVIAAAELV